MHARTPIAFLVALFVLFASAFARPVDDPERRAPAASAPDSKVFAWTSKKGLRYTWTLPPGYDAKTPRNLTVILHGTGLDYRWGHWNNKVGVFRPNDVVVSVDGTSEGQGDTRLFLGEPKDASAFAEFLEELRATFAVDRIYLYGHSQGGFFVTYFAGEYPNAVAGVVAHASGSWTWAKFAPGLKKVALAFMHGTGDPVVPYGQSPGARDTYVEKGFELVHLNRLDRYNHWPNAIRATETLDWCQGMTAKTPEEALDCAKRILTVKPADEYQWETLVDFSGARDVLRRLEGKGPVPFKSVDAKVASEAKTWIAAIEKHGAAHVKELEKTLLKKALVLDGKPWLGHLIPLRENFRGVDAVEAFLDVLKFDEKVKAHAKASKAMWEAWWNEKSEAKVAEAVLEGLPKGFLLDGFPSEFGERMEGLRKVELPGKLGFDAFDAWSKGWKDGLKQYENVWRTWEGPKARK
ncbi:MAG: alpha/beta fold hydrolase [Planctomycetes bacterium]|nr:alpha/beta fold hydrolase [Planctomycetota bacterium]